MQGLRKMACALAAALLCVSAFAVPAQALTRDPYQADEPHIAISKGAFSEAPSSNSARYGAAAIFDTGDADAPSMEYRNISWADGVNGDALVDALSASTANLGSWHGGVPTGQEYMARMQKLYELVGDQDEITLGNLFDNWCSIVLRPNTEPVAHDIAIFLSDFGYITADGAESFQPYFMSDFNQAMTDVLATPGVLGTVVNSEALPNEFGWVIKVAKPGYYFVFDNDAANESQLKLFDMTCFVPATGTVIEPKSDKPSLFGSGIYIDSLGEVRDAFTTSVGQTLHMVVPAELPANVVTLSSYPLDIQMAVGGGYTIQPESVHCYLAPANADASDLPASGEIDVAISVDDQTIEADLGNALSLMDVNGNPLQVTDSLTNMRNRSVVYLVADLVVNDSAAVGLAEGETNSENLRITGTMNYGADEIAGVATVTIQGYTFAVDATVSDAVNSLPVSAAGFAIYKVGSDVSETVQSVARFTKTEAEDGTPAYVFSSFALPVFDANGDLAETVDANSGIQLADEIEEGADPTIFYQVLPTSEDGKVKVAGLDAGTYVLSEAVVPSGHVAIGERSFEIHADPTLQSANATIVFNGENAAYQFVDANGQAMSSGAALARDTVNVNVLYGAGSLLPVAGGVGLPIFIGIAAVCMVFAVVWFCVRRKKAEA